MCPSRRHPGGDGRPAGRRTGAGHPLQVLRLPGRSSGHAPDVTLQIARMCATRLAGVPGPLRFRYTQRVFREAETENQVQARELTQCGVECIGEVGPAADAEIVVLFAEALRLAGATQFVLAMATVGVLRALLERSGASEPWKAAVLDAYHSSDFVALDRLCDVAMGRAVEGEAVDAGAAGPLTPRPSGSSRASGAPRTPSTRCARSWPRSGVWPIWTTSRPPTTFWARPAWPPPCSSTSRWPAPSTTTRASSSRPARPIWARLWAPAAATTA